MSTFDPAAFANIIITDSNDTQRLPVPIGEYMGLVEKQEVRSWKKRDDPSIGGLALDVTWTVEDEAVKAALGRDKVTVKQGIMLELTEQGGLAMGKGQNADLGRLREAVGCNTPGQPFTFAHLVGRPAKISIKHRLDGDNIFAEVKGVAKI